MTTPVPIAFPEGEFIVAMVSHVGAIFIATNKSVYKLQNGTDLVPLKVVVDAVPEVVEAVVARAEKIERQKADEIAAMVIALAPAEQAKK